MEGGKWEDLSTDLLVDIFKRVGMKSLLFDVPFVCKPWYKASREPQCWKHLIFPTITKHNHIFDYLDHFDDIFEDENKPYRDFSEILAMINHENTNLSTTEYVKFVVNLSCGNATIIKIYGDCTEEALDYVANKASSLLHYYYYYFKKI